MIRANDLMIGDWVVYNGDVDYTCPIRIEGMDISTGMCITSDRDDVGFDGVEPIPLTVEILEKNGFERIETKDNLVFVCDRLGKENYEILVRWQDSFDNGATDTFNHEHTDENWGLHIQCNNQSYTNEFSKRLYIHELQHALRLCGIEKSIEL